MILAGVALICFHYDSERKRQLRRLIMKFIGLVS